MNPNPATNTSILDNVLSRISFEEAAKEELMVQHTKAWDTFNQLLYAWKEEQKIPSGATRVNIVELAKKSEPLKYLSRDNRLYGSTPVALAWNEPPADSKVIEDLPYEHVMITLLEDYCSQLRMLREMVALYSTPELIAKHKTVANLQEK